MHQAKSPAHLTLDLPAKTMAACASLLQHGIFVPVDQPVAIVPFLLALPGFTAAYIEQTVQTIFVDGVAADSLERELSGGSTLALSAAMPGLAGAIFRRQGIHGTLRSRPNPAASADRAATGLVTLKLFNSIAADRVGDLLPQGILIAGRAFHDFAVRRQELLQARVRLHLDGHELGVDALLAAVRDLPLLHIQGRLLHT